MRRVRGFTLVEVLVALVIVVATLTVLAQGFTGSAGLAMRADRQTRAVLRARTKMAELESGELALTTSHAGEFGDHEGFVYGITSDLEAVGLYRVAVTVTWKEGETERSCTLHRLMRERVP